MISKFKNILTFFAHPDDETISAGATINKLTNNGCRVHVAIPATGVHARRGTINLKKRNKNLSNLRKDTIKAARIIGVKK